MTKESLGFAYNSYNLYTDIKNKYIKYKNM